MLTFTLYYLCKNPEAMRKATGFDYKYEIVGRRCVALSMYFDSLLDVRD